MGVCQPCSRCLPVHCTPARIAHCSPGSDVAAGAAGQQHEQLPRSPKVGSQMSGRVAVAVLNVGCRASLQQQTSGGWLPTACKHEA